MMWNTSAVRAFILARLSEPSTWRGIVLCAAGLGVSIAPERMDAIVSVGMLAAGIIGAGTSDK